VKAGFAKIIAVTTPQRGKRSHHAFLPNKWKTYKVGTGTAKIFPTDLEWKFQPNLRPCPSR